MCGTWVFGCGAYARAHAACALRFWFHEKGCGRKLHPFFILQKLQTLNKASEVLPLEQEFHDARLPLQRREEVGQPFLEAVVFTQNLLDDGAKLA